MKSLKKWIARNRTPKMVCAMFDLRKITDRNRHHFITHHLAPRANSRSIDWKTDDGNYNSPREISKPQKPIIHSASITLSLLLLT
jgi:hypothetical protein